ncbi:hypothetical protein ACQYWQ_12555 [Streptomyces sp. P6-2-1]|uniref:hypothetical protein n=1 Tax=unclassified Streptomyces TaxID=2593676 RepID=UPI003D36C168
MAESQQPETADQAKGPTIKPLKDSYATGSPADPDAAAKKPATDGDVTTLGDSYATGSPADPEAKILDRPEGDEKK